MNLKLLIAPKNDDGSIDYRYESISSQLCVLAGKECIAKLEEFYKQTSKLESEHSSAAVNLVRKSFEIDINEYQLKRVIKALTAALKELGFKPSKVSKIINSARFLQTYDWFEEAKCYFGSNSEKIGKDLFDELSEYFVGFGVGSLDVLSRMTKEGRKKAYRHFLKEGIRMSQKGLEALQREHPVNLKERRSRKSANAYFQNRYSAPVDTHQSMELMEDNNQEYLTNKLFPSHALIAHFFQLFTSGAIEKHLDEVTPAVQANLINEIKLGIPLLEEFVSKNKIVEINSKN